MAGLLAAVTPAHAAAPTAGSVVTIGSTSGYNAAKSTLSVAFDHTLNATELTKVKNTLADKAATVGVHPQVTGPQGAYLYCDHYYSFSDGDGTYSFQHACGGSTGPWGFQQSGALCSIVTGSVSEAGMTWTRNGSNMSRQAPHVEGCGYTFHGTYNPDNDYDWITYNDVLTFRVNVGGQTGSATLTIQGSFTSAGCTNGKTCGI
ncbi:hypothetical protein [Kitasatospora sp. MMS16-BH015]|uniref:hypothetical protein n=1 Tax=Kitasatospora sp. MMS16-BH015 TaxID=2018025 RepID=UPI00131A4D9D|nr:hypothetical protein [Kitasatospora sp. MMS16-BH015]